jgi:GNAT superfamily N-acetyltransferase
LSGEDLMCAPSTGATAMREPMPAIEIEIQPLDHPIASALVVQLMHELGERYPEEPKSKRLPTVEEFAPPAGTFLVALLAGRPAGCGALRRMKKDVAEVKRMYVAPWARRRGVAKKILAALEQAALGLGYRVVRLETGTRQPEAIALYEWAGYRPIPCYGEFADNPLSVCFEKNLREA